MATAGTYAEHTVKSRYELRVGEVLRRRVGWVHLGPIKEACAELADFLPEGSQLKPKPSGCLHPPFNLMFPAG